MGTPIWAGVTSGPDGEHGGRSDLQVPSKINTASGTIYDSFSSRWSEESYHATRTKEGDCSSKGPVISGVLQQALPCTQTVRRGQTYNRSVPLKQTVSCPIIQDGDTTICEGRRSTERVDDEHRHPRCLSSCSDGTICPEISEIPGGPRSAPVPVTSVWSLDLPPRIYQDFAAGSPITQGSRGEITCVSGRLADSGRFSSTGQTRCLLGSQRVTGLGVDSEPREIEFRSFPGLCFSRHSFQYGVRRRYCKTIRGHKGQAGQTTSKVESQPRGDSHAPGIDFWSPTVHGSNGPTRQNAAPAHSVENQVIVEPSHRPVDRQSCSATGAAEKAAVVDISGSSQRSTFGVSGSSVDNVHGRFVLRVGSGAEPASGLRNLEQVSGTTPYKRTRDSSCLAGSEEIFQNSVRQSCQSHDRQPDSCSLHPSFWRDSFQNSERPGVESSEASSQHEHNPMASVYSGIQECNCRLSIPSRTDPRDRVVPEPFSPSKGIREMGSTLVGPICDERQQTIGSVCESFSGSGSLSGRCSLIHLGRSRSDLCLPTFENRSRGDQEVQELFGNPDDSDSSIEGCVIMDTGIDSVITVENQIGQEPRPVISKGTGQGVNVSRFSRLFQSSRLATLEAIYISDGFSALASELIAKPQRVSTINLYQNRWKQFLRWFKSIEKHPAECTLSIFMDYLVHLSVSGLGPEAIKGHRAAIGPIYKALGWFDSSKDIHLSLLLRRFRLDKPRTRIACPRWNLELVLNSFLKYPYVDPTSGSDYHVELKWLTLKCVFLVALATGRRVSCLRALEYDFIVGRGNDHNQQVISLNTLPEFRAKNQRHCDASERIVIPGIAHLNPREPERLLCPVRCLRIYAKRTADRHTGCLRLFVNWLPGKSEITAGSVSRWVMLAVKQAYENSGDTPPSGIAAHEVRALSASWAYRNHVHLDDIKASLFWRSDGVFQNSYLRDMSSVSEGLSRLGPIVTAGRVITP